MRKFTTEHIVYNFDELSDEAKQKAIENLYDINTDHQWWEGDVEWFNDEIFAKHGLEVSNINFDLDRGSWLDFQSVTVTDERKLLKSIGVDLRTKTAKEVIEYGITVDKTYYPGAQFKTVFYPDTGDFTDKLDDLWQELTEDCLKRLRDEYEYYTSDEAIIETIKANEYEFYANGEMA